MEIKQRKAMIDKYKWDLSVVFSDDSAWESAFLQASKQVGKWEIYKGKLTDPSVLLDYYGKMDEYERTLENLYLYSKMKQDEDGGVDKYTAMVSKIKGLYVKISSALAFVMPEIMQYPSQQLLELAKEEKFTEYSYRLQEYARMKQHILSESEEKIISEVGSFASGFGEIFNMFDNVDVKFKKVKDENGNSVEMSHGAYGLLLQSEDRAVRKRAYQSMFGAFKNMNKTISAVYLGNVKKNNFYAKVRKYEGALDMALEGENVSSEVYYSLLDAVDNNLNLLHKYMTFRKQVLGYDKLNMYDLHFSIVENENIAMEYEDAYDLVKVALKPLGDEYIQLLEKAFSGGWIDVYENKGKRSGAYSWGTYDTHPYVLLNYNKTTHDIFTIAHEMGHALHSFFSNKTQPYAKAGYEIFVAEVASTVNEILLLKHLIKTSEGGRKRFLLSYYLDMFRTTLFRQTQFAEFEALIHKKAQDDVALSAELLNKEYKKLNKKYYGKDVVSDNLIAYEWSRIPHFYNSFYVYKYATGISSAVAIAGKILAGEKGALEGYMKFLSAGGSENPVDILKYAGVDLTKKESFELAFSEFEDALSQLESL